MAKKEEKKSLDEIVKELDKQYGKGAVMHGDEIEKYEDVVSTGSLGLDLATGIGGLPVGKSSGKIVELFGWESSGKSTLIQSVIGNYQKKFNRECLYVDGENSIDEKYSSTLGVDLKKLWTIQLDESAGEGAYNKAEKMVESGEFGLVVYDSYNSLQPKKIIDGEVGDNNLGLHARMLGQAVQKANNLCTKYGTTFIFIGQLREKIGVMFGCLHADTLVNFVNGKSLPIRKVVENKIQGEVWSWNEKLNIFEPRKIIDWHYNGDVVNNSDYLHFETDGINTDNGRFGFTVTQDHEIMTNNGWKKAKDINIGEKILSRYESFTGADGLNILKGCFVGDSSLSIRKNNTACIKFQDSKNEEYVKWKMNILSPLSFKKNGKKWESEYTYELSEFKKSINNRNPLDIFKDGYISWVSFAIWLMDDGHYKKSHKSYTLSVKRFKDDIKTLEKIGKLFTNLGLEFSIRKDGTFTFTVDSSKIIAEQIRQYVPQCMDYKLPNDLVILNKKTETIQLYSTKIIKDTYVSVNSKRIASPRQMRQKGKYDISVEDNHNYSVGGINNGIIVHNSPETTQGGNALRFYAHMRMRINRSVSKDNTIMDGDTKMGNLVTVDVIKNKLAPPFKRAQFNIMYGVGIDKIQEIVDIGHDIELLKVRGESLTYEDTKYSVDDFKQMLSDNPVFYEELRNKIIEKCQTQ